MAYNPKQDYYKDSKDYTGPRTGEKATYRDYVPTSSPNEKAPEKPEAVQREAGRRDAPKRDWVKIINKEGVKFWNTYKTMPYKQRESIIRHVNDLGILKAIGEYERLPKLQEMVTEKLATL